MAMIDDNGDDGDDDDGKEEEEQADDEDDVMAMIGDNGDDDDDDGKTEEEHVCKWEEITEQGENFPPIQSYLINKSVKMNVLKFRPCSLKRRSRFIDDHVRV